MSIYEYETGELEFEHGEHEFEFEHGEQEQFLGGILGSVLARRRVGEPA